MITCAWCTTTITDRSPSEDFCTEACAHLWRTHQHERTAWVSAGNETGVQ